MNDKELYTKDEIALFESLEKDIDSGAYRPMEKSKLDEKKKLFKESANNTINKEKDS